MKTVFKIATGLCGVALLCGGWCGCVAYTKHCFEKFLSDFNKAADFHLPGADVSVVLGEGESLSFTERRYPISVKISDYSFDYSLLISFGAVSLSGSLSLYDNEEKKAMKTLDGLSVNFNRITDDLSVTYEIDPGSTGGFSWSKGKLTILVDDLSKSNPDYARLRFKLGELAYKDIDTDVSFEKLKLKIDTNGVDFHARAIRYKESDSLVEIKKSRVYFDFSEIDEKGRFDQETKLSFGRVLLKNAVRSFDVDGLDFNAETTGLKLDETMLKSGTSPFFAIGRSALNRDNFLNFLDHDTRFAYEFDTQINDSDAEFEIKGWFECSQKSKSESGTDFLSCLRVKGYGEIERSFFDIQEIAFLKEAFRSYARDPESENFKYDIVKNSEEPKFIINGKEFLLQLQ
jgi:hypothetical protein